MSALDEAKAKLVDKVEITTFNRYKVEAILTELHDAMQAEISSQFQLLTEVAVREMEMREAAERESKAQTVRAIAAEGQLEAAERKLVELQSAQLDVSDDAAFRYAKTLAESLHRKHFQHVTNWKPLNYMLGLLTQIDNMTSRLVERTDIQNSEEV